MLKEVDGNTVIKICPLGTEGEVIVIEDLSIMLPKKPRKNKILYHDKKKKDQKWVREELPEDLKRIRSMDQWNEMPAPFRRKWEPYILEEFRRRKEGLWFYNNGEPTYITGHHYMLLQWGRMTVGYADYLDFQRKIHIHLQACFMDPRCMGQNFVKCRRSGYTNIAVNALVDEGTINKDKHLGIQSKTGADAQKNVFMKKLVPMYKSLPFFFKPIQDGSTNPRMELAFRDPSEKITKNSKVSVVGEALNTVIDWKNSTVNAYDGDELHRLFLDEAGKYEEVDVNELWQIERTCLIVGKKIRGKCLMGSTVNPLKKGGKNYKTIWNGSDPTKRDANGRTKTGLYRLFLPAFECLVGFFDEYGMPVIDDPEKPVMGIDGEMIYIGAKTYLKNEREGLKDNPGKLNETIRQFPFSPDEAFRDSIETSLFNVSKIYEQIYHNDTLIPNPVVRGNFVWASRDKEVVFDPKPNGRFRVSWLPNESERNVIATDKRGRLTAPFPNYGIIGVDSYDIDATVDGRGSKGAMHAYNKYSLNRPPNRFIVEYANRPDTAKIFYEDVLMCAFYYGYPILIENNKYGIARHFEERGYLEYMLDRPKHLGAKSTSKNTNRTKGVPSNSADLIHAHAQAIEQFIHNHVGQINEEGDVGYMYFNNTLEDWIDYDITKRTKYDLTISSGLCLLASQAPKPRKTEGTSMESVSFVRHHKPIRR